MSMGSERADLGGWGVAELLGEAIAHERPFGDRDERPHWSWNACRTKRSIGSTRSGATRRHDPP